MAIPARLTSVKRSIFENVLLDAADQCILAVPSAAVRIQYFGGGFMWMEEFLLLFSPLAKLKRTTVYGKLKTVILYRAETDEHVSMTMSMFYK